MKTQWLSCAISDSYPCRDTVEVMNGSGHDCRSGSRYRRRRIACILWRISEVSPLRTFSVLSFVSRALPHLLVILTRTASATWPTVDAAMVGHVPTAATVTAAS